MSKIAIRYVIIQFMPYIETREFANIGVVATSPKLGFFNYKIEHKYARLTNFFPKLEGRIYKEAIRAFEEELRRINNLFKSERYPADINRNIFDALVRPKETIIRFSPISVALSDNFEKSVDNIFDYYIQHSFAKGQKEEILTRRIAAFVRNLNTLKTPFVSDKRVGDDLYHVNFPLAQIEESGKLLKAIKPIYLGQNDSSEILYKWDSWRTKIERLSRQGLLEKGNQILFAYETTDSPTDKQLKAIEEILSESALLNVIMEKGNDFEKIENFAIN